MATGNREMSAAIFPSGRIAAFLFMGKRNVQRKFRQNGAPFAISATEMAQPGASPVQAEREYVVGFGQNNGLLAFPISAQPSDRFAPEVTFETYRQMMNDAEVSSDVRTLRDMVLADGVQLSPAFEGVAIDDGEPEFARAFEIAQFVQRSLDGLRKPLKKTLKGLLEAAIVYGHKTAEITWKNGVGIDRAKLMLDRIALKDHNSIDFVIDRFWNHVGFIPRQYTGQLTTGAIVPREKFLHLSLNEEDEDSRGRSSIRTTYTAWCFKALVWPEYRRWLENCALPSLVGKTAPKQPGDVQRNTDGTKKSNTLVSAAESMGQALAGLKNASYIVIPTGAEVDQLAVAGDGEGFERAVQVADSQIGKGILYQTLATGEAQFGTRAQSETHMGVLDLLVWELKGEVADVIKNDVIRQIIRYNFGDDAMKFSPLVSLGDSERRDWSKDATAAAMIEPAITDSQWNAITTQLGLPAPQPGEEPRGKTSMPTQPENQPTQPANKQEPKRAPKDQGAFVTIKVRAR